jgi:uncharacterized membrane protein
MMSWSRLRAWWGKLQSSYWFVPSVMTSLSVALAFSLLAADRRLGEDSTWLQWLYGGGADGARALLSAVASSTITVVSVTFSVTVVALTVASQHFGPRLLNNFMRDRAAQIVLGVFIATFVFCLIVLRTVQGDGDTYDRFVPHLSVTSAVVLTLLTVAALIYYVHHVSASMQVSRITLMVVRDLEAAIDRLYPNDAGEEPSGSIGRSPPIPEGAEDLASESSGYVQAIDLGAALALAQKHDLTIWICARPGEFVTQGARLAAVYPPPAGARRFAAKFRRAYVFGSDRSSHQDAAFAIQQLVEVALHALSPAMNEPFTAITCIDRLGQGLGRLACRQLPAAVREDEHGRPRLVAEPQTFSDLLEIAFQPITVYAGSNPAIYQRVLETLETLAQRARRAADRAAIVRQAEHVRQSASHAVSGASFARLEELYQRVTTAAVEPRLESSTVARASGTSPGT